MKKIIKKTAQKLNGLISRCNNAGDETLLLAVGSLLSNQQYLIKSSNINDFEYKIFSQFGDDGIIQYLIKNVAIKNTTFIEFGVGDYDESNTKFLMMNNNWSGFVMDCSAKSINKLQSKNWSWKYDLTCKNVFIDKENINDLLKNTGLSNIGLLSIDIDGNDYHVFNEINLSKLNPSIIIIEYNSLFGDKRLISTPYDKNFVRTKAHYSNLFFGASLPALDYLATRKGYSLIGCNLAGNNSYFVRRDLLGEKIKNLSVEDAYIGSKFRESRDQEGRLSHIGGRERFKIIKGLSVVNVKTNKKETL